MNRKEFLKSVAGIFAVGAIAPTAIVQASPVDCISPTPPPTALPTNEELWEAHVEGGVRNIENMFMSPPKYHRWLDGMSRPQYQRVKEVAPSKGWTIEEKIIDGVTTVAIGPWYGIIY
jgi:hypothetical protein